MSASAAGRLARSFVRGPTHPSLVQQTLPQYFASRILAPHGDRPALSARSEARSQRQRSNVRYLRWSFGELHEHVQAAARGMIGLGIRKGDRVGVIMGNNSAYLTLQWACAAIGAILVTLNPAYRQHELISALQVSGASHLFLVPHIRTSSYLSLLAPLPPNNPQLPNLRSVIVVDADSAQGPEVATLAQGTVDWRELLMWRSDGWEDVLVKEIGGQLHKDDVINLQFTSGTTGLPKAVSLTHHNLINNGLLIGRSMRLTEQDSLCCVPPLFHCFGNLAFHTHAAHIVYPSPIFDPVKVLDTLEDDDAACTALHGVPTHFLGILAEADKRGGFRSTRLRTGIAAGSSTPIELMKRLIEKMGLTELTNAYGMTETSPVSFQTVTTDSLIKRVETVGRPLPHVTAKIIDNNGEVVPVGVPGEVCVSGYLLQTGYWQDPEQTNAVMRHDDEGVLWMHTGDEGILDDDGYLRIVGRIKDIIIRGGENLFPVQIENMLAAHPGVREGAAIAVPDPVYGEVVGVWIVREPGAAGQVLTGQNIRNWVASGMNPQNAPAWVWFAGEDGGDLPKTASGKVQKHILREWSRTLAHRGTGRVSR